MKYRVLKIKINRDYSNSIFFVVIVIKKILDKRINILYYKYIIQIYLKKLYFLTILYIY